MAKTPGPIVDALKTVMGKWNFWKRLPLKVFKVLVKDENVSTLLHADAFKVMTKEQRQLILNSGDKDSNTTNCTQLPVGILKGKESRILGLTVSSKCIKAKLGQPNAAEFVGRALRHGMCDPAVVKKFDKLLVDAMVVKIKREPKIDPVTGKKEKRDPYEFKGLLAFEALKTLPNGADFVKEFMAHKDDNIVKEVCALISEDDLKKAKWLQALLTRKCVKNIPINSIETAKKLHNNIWTHMSKKQIKAMIDRSDYKTLDGPFMAGLAANKDFAEMSCKEKTKEDDKGKDVAKTSIMMKVQPSARSKYFDHNYVKNLPDTDECKKLFLANVPSFADSALAAADAAYIASRPDLLKGIRDEQFGHISDEVQENSYPASLQAGSISAISKERCANLSAKFVGKMSAAGLAAFSADQIKAIPAVSLCLVCDDKQKAIKHELSPEQKESLGKDCPAKAGSMAPTNANIGAFAVVAAAAAGSLAFFL